MSLWIGAAALAVNAGMHIPYLFNDPDEIQAGGGSELAMSLVPINSVTYDPFDRHWWWDNMTHVLWGVTLGSVFEALAWPVLLTFLLVTTAWEIYEYGAKERPWHVDENGDMLWSFDHAAEDTVLDTVMGLAGAYLVLLL